MSEEALRVLEIGVAGVAVSIATYVLGIFRIELIGVVFWITTLAGQSVLAFLEQFGSPSIAPGTTDIPS
jgi:hypothetical protein